MPKQTFALEQGAPKRLEISWSGLWKNVQITLEIGRLFDILRRHRIQARSHMTMVNLALMTAEGMGKRLDPTLQLNEAALPYLAEALGMTASAAG